MNRYEQIWRSLEDDEYRRAFNVDVDTGLAFQIRALREKNGWTQDQLGERAGGKKQEVISQWENPNYGRYSLQSLKSLAVAFDVGLMVRFVPFSDLVNWNANLTPERIAPPSFDEEAHARNQPSQALTAQPGKPFTVAADDDHLRGLVTAKNLIALTASHIEHSKDPIEATRPWASSTAIEPKEKDNARAA